jgi:hypothetical protein
MTLDGNFSPVSKDQVLDICCNFVIFDGTLDTFRFAHLSVREFLEKKPEYEIKSINSTVAETCLQLLIATAQHLAAKRIMPKELHPSAAGSLFANDSRIYPTLYWASHCQLAGDKRCNGTLKDLLSRFVCNESDPASAFAIWANQFYQLSTGFTTYEDWRVKEKMEDTQATPASFLFIACAFNFYEVIRDRLAMLGLHCDFLNDKHETPLLVAMKHSSCEVILELLNEETTQITEEVVKAAARNSRNGKEVMTLLLDRRGADVRITEEVVKAAAGNSGNGKEVMTLLLDRRGVDVRITEEVV